MTLSLEQHKEWIEAEIEQVERKTGSPLLYLSFLSREELLKYIEENWQHRLPPTNLESMPESDLLQLLRRWLEEAHGLSFLKADLAEVNLRLKG